MAKLNVFIDGTWLFRVCQPDGVLSNRTIYSTKRFNLDFTKFIDSLILHLNNQGKATEGVGDLYLSTSIFDFSDDINEWPSESDEITSNDIERVIKGAIARELMVTNAVSAGFDSSAVYKPRLRPFMIGKIKNGTYQEKQVDATVIALLVKSAITKREDYHVFVTGDSDVLPAIKVAYPEYSKNVLLATTHPDELRAEHRQTSFSYTDFAFDITPYFLQDHVKDILFGNNVYECSKCKIVFNLLTPLSQRSRPYCKDCSRSRT